MHALLTSDLRDNHATNDAYAPSIKKNTTYVTKDSKDHKGHHLLVPGTIKQKKK